MTEPSLLSFVSNADPLVKAVIFVLISASIVSWGLIIQRFLFFKQTKQIISNFEARFGLGENTSALMAELRGKDCTATEKIFQAGLKEFNRLKQKPKINPDAVMQGVQRAMRIAQANEVDRLETHLSFLATVGSTSPYVGLFGTVWGIMTSLRALGQVQQASISMVAPGISEALIATAVGLFAAIPAVIAYNRFVNQVDKIALSYETFQDEFTNILNREIYTETEAG